MISYLLDSGFLYAYLDEKDVHHKDASSILDEISNPIILPIPAITEVTYFLQRDVGIKALVNFIESLSETDFILETPTA